MENKNKLTEKEKNYLLERLESALQAEPIMMSSYLSEDKKEQYIFEFDSFRKLKKIVEEN
jgi:hypothetical protein